MRQSLAHMVTSTRGCAKDDCRTARLGSAALSLYYAAWKQVPEIDLRKLVLNNVVLTGADLSGRDFSGTSLRYANLDNVNITGANLSFATLPACGWMKLKNCWRYGRQMRSSPICMRCTETAFCGNGRISLHHSVLLFLPAGNIRASQYPMAE